MEKFSYKEEATSQCPTFYFNGFLTEVAQLPDLNKYNNEVKFVLKDVTGINSVGTRGWVQWLKKSISVKKIYLEEAPPLFIKMFNQVEGAIDQKIIVKSFLVPYFSEVTGENANALLRQGENYGSGHPLQFPELRDSKGNSMEPDVLDDYFGFLK